MSIQTILAVGFGGFFGANLRLILNGVANQNFHLLSIPVGTLSVNLLGSLLIGFFFAIFHNFEISPEIKTFLSTGFLGALTTFSTFAYENLLLLQGGNFFGAFLNMSLNLFGTILFAFVGLKFGNLIFN
ncbi:crcB protein [Thiovulum sp. ES]|nr:crcB protein [Thiovulum sp. ES]